MFARINSCEATGLSFPEQGVPSSSRRVKEPGAGQAEGAQWRAEKHLGGNYSCRRDNGNGGIGKSVTSRAGAMLPLGPTEAHLEQRPVSSSGSTVQERQEENPAEATKMMRSLEHL